MKKTSSLNLPIVAAVAVMCATALVLFFLQRSRGVEDDSAANKTAADIRDAVDDAGSGDIEYYLGEAEAFEAALPSDKCIVAKLIDDENHHIVYIETGLHPSCYLYDLETLTTSVLFGGENGFYIDTKLLILRKITVWKRMGGWVVFVAENGAPEVEPPEAVQVFAMDVFTHDMLYIDSGVQASFPDSSHVTLQKASLLYRKLFTGKGVYATTDATYDLHWLFSD